MSVAISQTEPVSAAVTECVSGQCGPVPLIVGATGHRDLEPNHLAQLRARVCEVLTELKRTCPNTPLVVLSPLIDGAAAELGTSLAMVQRVWKANGLQPHRAETFQAFE